MNKFILILSFIFISNYCFSQGNEIIKSRSIVNEIIDKNIELKNSELLIYGISDKSFIFIINNKSYDKYFVKYENNYSSIQKIHSSGKKKLFNKAFNENCNFDSIDFSKYKYELSKGVKNYYAIKKDGKYYCEFQLSIIIQPIPIDEKQYKYLNKILLHEVFNKL